MPRVSARRTRGCGHGHCTWIRIPAGDRRWADRNLLCLVHGHDRRSGSQPRGGRSQIASRRGTRPLAAARCPGPADRLASSARLPALICPRITNGSAACPEHGAAPCSRLTQPLRRVRLRCYAPHHQRFTTASPRMPVADIARLPELPVSAVLPDLEAARDDNGVAVLVAPPGAGKTTLVPLALLDAGWRGDGTILLLEPRRLAARAAARRMASLLGEEPGGTVGYAMRMESRISAATLVRVVTEGVLSRLILDDPELKGIAAIVFDEFHERSLDGDFGLALALDVRGALRPDLRLLVMSATLDGARVAAL